MNKLKLYIATSLNGKIATPDGSVAWLDEIPNPTQTDYGYADFLNSITTTVQGFSTYKQVMSWDIPFPYPDKKNIVLTQQTALSDTENVTFVRQKHADFLRQLKAQSDGEIWLIGGGKANAFCLNEGLIDEILVFVMPVVLEGGVDLFGGVPKRTQLRLVTARPFPSGAVLLHYEVLSNSEII